MNRGAVSRDASPQVREAMRAVHAAHPGWYRAAHPGQRVTLASLAGKGVLERRAWRGDGADRNSAFEYRFSRATCEALDVPPPPAGPPEPHA